MADYELNIKDMSIDNIDTRSQIIRKMYDEAFFGAMGELLKKIEKLDDEDMSIHAKHLSNRAVQLRDIVVRSFKKIDELENN